MKKKIGALGLAALVAATGITVASYHKPTTTKAAYKVICVESHVLGHPMPEVCMYDPR